MTTETSDSKPKLNPDPNSSSAASSVPSSHPSSFLQLSRDVAAVVAAAGPYAAQIDGGRRLAAGGTGVARAGVVGAAGHHLARDADVLGRPEGGERPPAAPGARGRPPRPG